MNRIVIIGRVGQGKSFKAKKISKEQNLIPIIFSKEDFENTELFSKKLISVKTMSLFGQKKSIKQAEQKISTTKKQKKPAEQKHTKLSVDALQQQIAQLGAKIRHSQQSAEQTDIKFVNSISTHKYVAAQYVNDWEQKVESVGNLNYPEAARKKGFSGTLTTDVGINADGSIYSIRITKSSGNKALDDAAKRIIRLSAPFAALPKELLKELKVLVITRVWKFSDESGITTR